jgi:hypothetical protein
MNRAGQPWVKPGHDDGVVNATTVVHRPVDLRAMHSDVLELPVAHRRKRPHGSQALPPIGMRSPPADESGDHVGRRMPAGVVSGDQDLLPLQ